MQVGGDEIAERSPKAIRRDFGTLGQLAEGSVAQVVFSSILSLAEKSTERGRKTHLTDRWLRDWCHWWNFCFFDHEEVYKAPGLLATDGVQLSRRGKRVLGHELAGLIEGFKLGSKGEGNIPQLTRDKPRHVMLGLGVRSIAQLKCIYANAHNMRNKHKELEAIVEQDGYNLITITETWWDDSHDWTAAMDGYKLLSRDRRGKRGDGLVLYVRDCFDCIELDNCDDKVGCLWVKMRGKANKADILLGVCYRPLNQNEEADEVFCKRLAEVSQSLALVLMGDFNLPDICWK